MDTLINKVHCMDALELLAMLPDGCIDAIVTDLPYQTTQNVWDVLIPFAPMWAGVKRVLKPRGVFVTTSSQPFTSKLIMSNLDWFHEELIWDKSLATGFLDANKKHLRQHEHVLVFCDGMPTYNPQMAKGEPYSRPPKKLTSNYGLFIEMAGNNPTGDRYPKSIINISNADRTNTEHPTQKPVALYEYLIKTYTEPDALVLDFCAGSGTTGLAAKKTNRRYILNDSAPEYVAIAQQRLTDMPPDVVVAEGVVQQSLFEAM